MIKKKIISLIYNYFSLSLISKAIKFFFFNDLIKTKLT